MKEKSVASYDHQLCQEPANVHGAERNSLVFLSTSIEMSGGMGYTEHVSTSYPHMQWKWTLWPMCQALGSQLEHAMLDVPLLVEIICLNFIAAR